MRFRMSCRVFIGVFLLLQLCDAGDKGPEDIALMMQKNVEHLIEKILVQIQEYYREIKSELKCIPDYVPDNLIETLKKSIDCVHENERNFVSGKIRAKAHLKNFLKCFSNAKKEVQDTIKAINPTQDHCPANMTEKTYQINVTTTFTKTFHINIKNGLEVTHKKIEFSKDAQHCFDHNSRSDSGNDGTGKANTTEEESTSSYDSLNYNSSKNHHENPTNNLNGGNNSANDSNVLDDNKENHGETENVTSNHSSKNTDDFNQEHNTNGKDNAAESLDDPEHPDPDENKELNNPKSKKKNTTSDVYLDYRKAEEEDIEANEYYDIENDTNEGNSRSIDEYDYGDLKNIDEDGEEGSREPTYERRGEMKERKENWQNMRKNSGGDDSYDKSEFQETSGLL